MFPDASINTSLTFALTHEIVSYAGGVEALKRLAAALFMQAAPGGVWINSDVCGPEDGDRDVVLHFKEPGLDHPTRDLEELTSAGVKAYIDGLTPAARLPQFAQDFRRLAGAPFRFAALDSRSARLALRDAMEFMSKFRYADSWLSECHERFCTLTWPDWASLLQAAGFEIDPRSGSWRTEWMVENMFKPAATLTSLDGDEVSWPSTHLFAVAVRPMTAQ